METGVCHPAGGIHNGCAKKIFTKCNASPSPTPPTPPGPPPDPSDAVDWVAKGAVTPIKNQAHCGSCWAFSTTGGLEGAIFVKHGVLESLSEEELVQCDKVDHGCQGGAMDNGFDFIQKTGGIATEANYPYTTATGGGTTGTCVKAKETPIAKYTNTVIGHHDVTTNSETALKAAVKMHPVSVAIEADKQVFQFYKTGILKANSGCGTKLDHGVLAVGYGVEDGTMYWKVKNSWGPTWGDQGYIKLERKESASSKGTCGIAMDASYPTLA
jgi:C1A family cysteine protease